MLLMLADKTVQIPDCAAVPPDIRVIVAWILIPTILAFILASSIVAYHWVDKR